VGTAIGITPDTVDGKVFPHSGKTISHFLNRGNTRRMDIVKTWTETCSKVLEFKDLQKLKIGFGVFNRDDICIESLNSPENVIEIGLIVSIEPR